MNKEANKRTLERFNNYRESNGVTFQFLARKVGLHYNTISQWRKGKISLGLDSLRRIEDYIDTKEGK
ncbi:helix-turn-helix domain-containing protein [Bacillus nitratireducens]|uniref:helix-turn-helix domain-containing protein n=1 Tax=Bacillus nitratireducens TaxID=2026193 RepID=UPI000B443964|nr:helix-turn-helix transcriptional regulator [Bacillus nitratireducens]PDY08451.1 XRE family transcriptional regulator [Bacillus cereus]PFJ45212.1 XRE family transcriptional regulator [Bacillus cereus]PFW08791.1 XRE family transcriptional regulator [Bacillus cereus]PGW92606.1 XRE family transcriptional regulator [Bacillus cereus]PGY15587.1 XRE family transcriptional regulator [Bacillus cereus]